MSDALPVIRDTIDQYMHKQEFARALHMLKRQTVLHPDDFSLKYRYLQISTIYLQNFLNQPEVVLQIMTSLPYYAALKREDFDHPELKDNINQICHLLLLVEADDKREFLKQLFEPFSKWMNNEAFLQVKDVEEARKFAAIRRLLKNLLLRTTIDESGKWMYTLGLDWLTESDIKRNGTQKLPLAHHCLKKYIGYINHEYYRLTELEDIQTLKRIGEECISLTERVQSFYDINPIPQYAAQLTNVRYNLIRMIPEHFSKEVFEQLNWEIITQTKEELRPVIEKRGNLNAYASSRRLLRCLENVEKYDLVLGALCYGVMENTDSFRPLGYKSLLRFVRCCLANKQGYLAKSEVEYTLENKDLAREEEEIQQQIHEIINTEWYQSAASFDTTYTKLEKYSCFLIFMNQ
ncbi:hypothetical protein [Enterococcus cecorum]|uniref:hypothetical protein n=1 Tax=Enterococcus cecorum TaxID=44008 RepID=UPI000A5CE80A|nr:hypothetical protein [Enterococcus cecorum]CAI3354566.1 hypothetical protein CIRMBP1316_00505 [Enterococcus cecorum]